MYCIFFLSEYKFNVMYNIKDLKVNFRLLRVGIYENINISINKLMFVQNQFFIDVFKFGFNLVNRQVDVSFVIFFGGIVVGLYKRFEEFVLYEFWDFNF